MFVLHALLETHVPDEYLFVVWVGSNYFAILGPAFEWVYFSRVDQNFCDIKFCLLAFQKLLVVWTSLTNLLVLINRKPGPVWIALKLVALLSYVDFCNSKKGCSSSSPLKIVVFIIISVFVRPCSKVDSLAHTSWMRMHWWPKRTTANKMVRSKGIEIVVKVGLASISKRLILSEHFTSVHLIKSIINQT